MADATPTTPTGTSSTPVSPTPAGEGQSTPAAAAPTTDATPTTPTTAATPPTSVAAPGPAATQDATPSADAKPAPLFTIPETIKLAPEATAKFDSFLRTKLTADGKVTLTSQEVMDQFLEQAQDANLRWQKQVTDTDKANEALCKQRFTPAQLSAAETAIGFASSLDPSFRELAKRQLNDPVFVNFMREIGERLSEDTFETAGNPPPPQNKKSAAERMGYAKPKPN